MTLKLPYLLSVTLVCCDFVCFVIHGGSDNLYSASL